MPEPERISGENPSMPTAALQAGIEGQVVLLIHVGANGRVTKVVVIKKLPVLAEHCARVVRSWRYKPYVHNGQSVPFIVRQPFVFKLSQ